MRGNFATHFENYLLRFSVILDPAIIITITNDKTRLINYKLAFINDEIWSGNKALPILGYETMILKIENQTMLLKKCSILSTPINYLSSLTEATQERHLLEQPKGFHELT
jgi:hypothetical protein